MAKYQRFEDLPVWQVARSLVNAVYSLSRKGEFARDFGLRDQIRRAAVSIVSNIAEGFESDATSQFLRYLGYAKGSTAEVRSQLYIALDQSFVSVEEFQGALELVNSCGRQLSGFMEYLRKHDLARKVSDDQIEYEISPEP
jgi:four helix bundle protein